MPPTARLPLCCCRFMAESLHFPFFPLFYHNSVILLIYVCVCAFVCCTFSCNVAVMLLTDIVVDGIPGIDWTLHLPLMLHILFLGLDHTRVIVREHCKQLCINLLVSRLSLASCQSSVWVYVYSHVLTRFCSYMCYYVTVNFNVFNLIGALCFHCRSFWPSTMTIWPSLVFCWIAKPQNWTWG